MALQIEDGAGSGRRARVCAQNRLYVSSESFVAEEVAATNGDSFILHGQCHLAGAASGGLMAFTNDSDLYDIYISRIYIDVHALITNVYINQVKEPTVTNGTDISATGIVNKNYGSGAVLVATLKISDGSSDITLADGIDYHSFPGVSMTSYQRDMKGTNVITPNTTVAWGWTAVTGSATDGDIISISANIYRRLRTSV